MVLNSLLLGIYYKPHLPVFGDIDDVNCGGEFAIATNCDDQDDNDNTIYFTPSSHFLCLCCTLSLVIGSSVGA